MTCEHVRGLLPELAAGEVALAGDVATHLVGCGGCRSDLDRYRSVVGRLEGLRDRMIDPPEGFLGRVLAEVPPAHWPMRVRQTLTEHQLERVALPVGGVVVGAAAVGLLWWRAAHRVTTGAPFPSVPSVSEALS